MPISEYLDLDGARVLELLSLPQPTLVLCHVRPDADALGSAMALSLWLQKKGSPARVVCANEIPERLRFLCADVQESILPSAVPAGFENARVITVDTASPAQLGELWDTFKDRICLMIDHHARGTRYADGWVVSCAATGEMIYDLIADSGEDMTGKCSELLYAAISSDTGGFRYSNTTPGTHLRAAVLLESGIDAAYVNHMLLEVKSQKLLAAEAEGFKHLHLYDGGRIAILTFPYECKRDLELLDEHLETLIDVARRVSGVEIAAAIRQPQAEPVFRLSTRASVDFDVSAVCATFGGGGHPRAAGATLTGFADMNGAEQAVLAAIRARC
jgi:phosphoesterase RecJ-like protein